MTQKDFDTYLSLKLNPKLNDSIPSMRITGADIYIDTAYYLLKLDPLDPRAACLGKITGCCQSLGNIHGESCALYGMTNPDSGFYVICKGKGNKQSIDDPIVSMAWAWRNQTGALVLDSMESLEKNAKGQFAKTAFTNEEVWINLYGELARQLVTKQGVSKVMIGKGGRTPNTMGLSGIGTLGEQAFEFPKDDYRGYRDSHQQAVLALSLFPLYECSILVNENNVGGELAKNAALKTLEAYFNGIPATQTLLDLPYMRDWVASCVQNGMAFPLEQLVSFIPESRQKEFKELLNNHLAMYKLCQQDIQSIDRNSLKMLLAKGVFLEFRDANRNTLLLKAVKGRDRELIQLLLAQSNIDLNVKDGENRTPLQIAAITENWEALKWLAAQPSIDLNPLRRADYNEETILFRVAKAENWETVKYLIEQSTPRNTLSLDSSTHNMGDNGVLRLLVKAKNIEMIEWLGLHSIHLYPIQYYFAAILKIAIDEANDVVLKWLIEKSTLPLEAESLNIALLEAATKSHWEMVKLLAIHLKTHLNVNINDTVLLIAANSTNWEMVKWLIAQSNVDINVKGQDNQTVLSIAIYQGNWEMVQWLSAQPSVDLKEYCE